jgi:hypothetical protein
MSKNIIQSEIQTSANDSPQNGGRRDPEVVTTSALLKIEMEETNNWARLGAQLYFGWFTLILTINGLATGWVFTRTGGMPRLARLIFAVFIAVNLMGAVAAYHIRNHMLNCDRRIKEVIANLTKHQSIKDVPLTPNSAVALQAVNTVFIYTASSMMMLALFWTTLEIWPNILLSGNS